MQCTDPVSNLYKSAIFYHLAVNLKDWFQCFVVYDVDRSIFVEKGLTARLQHFHNKVRRSGLRCQDRLACFLFDNFCFLHKVIPGDICEIIYGEACLLQHISTQALDNGTIVERNSVVLPIQSRVSNFCG